MSIRDGVTVRGTSNGNERGSAEARRRRKEWMLDTYRADHDLLLTPIDTIYGSVTVGEPHESWAPNSTRVKACRCYRCGNLLHFGTLTIDRIIPGVRGGSYRRDNIRPACGRCNSETGVTLAAHGTTAVLVNESVTLEINWNEDDGEYVIDDRVGS